MKNSALILSLAVLTFCLRSEEANRLNEVLAEGETWQLVSEGHGFSDGACSDADGNVYFSDMSKGIIYKIGAASGKAEAFIENAPKISGMKWAPDGRLICCQSGSKKIVAFDKDKKISTLAENVGVNDLIVSKKGDIYFSGTGNQVTRIDPAGKLSVAAKDLGSPNGISLSPDQKTLAVSDYRGVNVFTLPVNDDGSLGEKQALMVLKCTADKPNSSGGDGMTTSADGHYFVTSNLGIQVFDKSGANLGTIDKPQNKGLVNLAFGGPEMNQLFCCNSDKIYKRKMKVTGMVFYK